jgi:hypothetical protein
MTALVALAVSRQTRTAESVDEQAADRRAEGCRS